MIVNKPEPINFNTVADLYDAYVNIQTDISFYLKETEGFADPILELMCGTGRVSIPLLEAGRKLVCVDYSNGMLDVFRNKIKDKNYTAELIEMDVVNLSLPRKFSLILLPFHSLSEILEIEKQILALKRISEHLSAGGTFICTLQNPAVRLRTADGTLRILGEFNAGKNKMVKVSYMNQWNPGTGIVTGYQYYELFDNGCLVEKRKMEINFRPVPDSEFRDMIINTGLDITEIYGDYSYSEFNQDTSSFMIYKLIKAE